MRTIKQKYTSRGKATLRMVDHFWAHKEMCAPTLDAILDSCGIQNGTFAMKVAHE